MNRKAAFLFGALLSVAFATVAATGGFPSRPRFSSVGIGTAPPAGSGKMTMSDAAVNLGFIESDQASGSQASRFQINSAELRYQICADAFASCSLTPLTIARAGNVTIAAPTGGAALSVVPFASTSVSGIDMTATGNNLSQMTLASGSAGQASISVNASGTEALCMTSNATAGSGQCGMPAGKYGLATFVGQPIELHSAGGATVNGVAIATETTGTFTFTPSGLTTTPSCTVSYVKHGNLVTLKIGTAGTCTGTSNTTGGPGSTAAAIPAALRPTSYTRTYAPCTNNTTDAQCVVEVQSIGFLNVGCGNSPGAGCTAAGTKGWSNAVTVSYTLQ